MDQVKLFAWTVPALFPGSVVDHTWVTTYDNRRFKYADIAEVERAKEHYWYCWGSFQPKGGTPRNATGFLASGAASLSYASCLCLPNADSWKTPAARGAVFRYGVDGVCHQLANQILWATDPSGTLPLVVAKARGYWISNGMFGTYGTQHAAWAAKRQQCNPTKGAEMSATSTSSIDDDFEQHARSALQGRDGALEKVQQLIERRRAFMSQMEGLRNNPAFAAGGPSAADLNKLYSSFLREAARILGDDDFVRVFDERPEEEMNVVDPDIYNAQAHDR
jgi:hypothetical protein